MYKEEAKEADIKGKFLLTVLNKIKYKDFDHINGKSPLIFKKILVFPNLSEILRLFFKHSEFNIHTVITEPNNEKKEC